LLPLPWWGPVLAPVLISLLMILWGTFASQFERAPRATRSNRQVWVLNMAGMALALYVFMADATTAAHRGLDSIRTVLPERFNWPLFGVALVLMSAPVMQIGRRLLMPQPAKAEIIERTKEFSCPRHLEN
jgi:hypothetical protein